MNHKRVSRRRNDKVGGRRTTHKQFRQAESAAIRGDRPRVKQPNWSAPPREDELPDHERKGKKRSKRSIQYCPAREGRKRHHYMEGEETHRYFVPKVYDWLPSGWRNYTSRYKLCVYCGDVKPVGHRRWRKGLY